VALGAPVAPAISPVFLDRASPWSSGEASRAAIGPRVTTDPATWLTSDKPGGRWPG